MVFVEKVERQRERMAETLDGSVEKTRIAEIGEAYLSTSILFDVA